MPLPVHALHSKIHLKTDPLSPRKLASPFPAEGDPVTTLTTGAAPVFTGAIPPVEVPPTIYVHCPETFSPSMTASIRPCDP